VSIYSLLPEKELMNRIKKEKKRREAMIYVGRITINI
jgi:hypothetical protein